MKISLHANIKKDIERKDGVCFIFKFFICEASRSIYLKLVFFDNLYLNDSSSQESGYLHTIRNFPHLPCVCQRQGLCSIPLWPE